MKKKVIIISGALLAVLLFIISLYFFGLTPVSKDSKTVLFNIKAGTNKIEIVNDLKDAGLLKSKFSSYIYVILNRNLNLQAGKYELSPNMSTNAILKKIHEGKIKEEKNTFNITFVEGKRLVDYAKVIAENTNTAEEEVLNLLSDKTYLQELIDKYWFLTDDILDKDIYYPLEGYLFASTYEFYKGSTVKDIVARMLEGTETNLNNLKELVDESKYTVHEILTMASIVELEGVNDTDRSGVAGVFYNRLKTGDSLGSDVTTYYAARKDFSTDLKMSELNNCNNGYNTRNGCNRGKLPVGPICSASLASLKASLEPDNHDYYFFVADKNRKTYFTKTNWEHEAKVSELKQNGLWYEY